uniref:LapA_dom domain-containing protein n=1 Tax=Steinernema glaseri TaxID=37863 RepID=A0A1I7ZUT6_9BILA
MRGWAAFVVCISILAVEASSATFTSVQDDASTWWQIPVLLFVVVAFLTIFIILIVLIFILAKIKNYRNQQADLSKKIDQRLKNHARKVTEDTRDQTLQNFRSLVNQYHAVRRAKRQEAYQKQLQSGVQSQITAVSKNRDALQLDRTQSSLESDTTKSQGVEAQHSTIS